MSEHNLETTVPLLPKKLRLSLKLPFRRFRSPAYRSANAFAQLYEQTHTSVARYIYGISGHTAVEVEDLTAETYERAWKARKRFSGDEDAALGWLFTIARRLVIDKYRQKERYGIPDQLNEQLTADNGEGPEQKAISQEQRQILWQLLDDLPERSREILVLRYLVGWRVKQIAAHLELSDNHVSVIIRRELSRLREAWPTAQENLAVATSRESES